MANIPEHALARSFRVNGTWSKLDHDNTNWQRPCANCAGKGNVKVSCCSHSPCTTCGGYGVANLGDK